MLTDIAEWIGLLAGSWALGYCASYAITAFKKGVEQL